MELFSASDRLATRDAQHPESDVPNSCDVKSISHMHCAKSA